MIFLRIFFKILKKFVFGFLEFIDLFQNYSYILEVTQHFKSLIITICNSDNFLNSDLKKNKPPRFSRTYNIILTNSQFNKSISSQLYDK